MPLFFFDAHGGLWFDLGRTTDHPDAVAFGPSGCARMATADEAGLDLAEGETLYTAAQRVGRLIPADPDNGVEWATLARGWQWRAPTTDWQPAMTEEMAIAAARARLVELREEADDEITVSDLMPDAGGVMGRTLTLHGRAYLHTAYIEAT